jgi:hypothetical protein
MGKLKSYQELRRKTVNSLRAVIQMQADYISCPLEIQSFLPIRTIPFGSITGKLDQQTSTPHIRWPIAGVSMTSKRGQKTQIYIGATEVLNKP